MISRALGPALGGSIGLMFTVANTISVATYTIGFSESLLDFLQVLYTVKDLLYQWYFNLISSYYSYNILTFNHYNALGCDTFMGWYRNIPG